MKSRRVLLFHPAVLPPRDYGGVERMVLWLAKGLRESGHDVWVAAASGSVLPEGIRLLETEPGDAGVQGIGSRLPSGLDVVHFMAPPGGTIMNELPCASLVTVHGNGKPCESFPRNSVFLSRNHAERHRADVFVHNGIDPAEYVFDPSSKGREFLFLSKTSWRVKNLAGAVRFCRKAGVALQIAGGNRPFGLRVRTHFSRSLTWIGPVGGARKARLLAQARALVFPVSWHEPFGLVIAEALMSGTPVIASDRGSVPELLGPEVGAVIPLDDEDGWVAELVSEPSRWDPERCRDWAMDRFHYAKMARSYGELYERLLSGASLHEQEPVSGGWRGYDQTL